MRLVFDIEGDALHATKIWMIVAKDISTGTIYKFGSQSISGVMGTIEDGIAFLKNADLLIGHNTIGYDIPTIDRLYGTDLLMECKHHDTFVMSQTLNYKRPHKHGLGGWGEKLGSSKIDFDVEKFTQGDDPEVFKEMLRYCVQDVELNAKVYDVLLNEFNKIVKHKPLIKRGLQVEHDTALFNTFVRERGWHFEMEEAKGILGSMHRRMREIENKLEPMMGNKVVFIDKEPKTPKFKKNGTYTATTCRLLSEFFEKEVLPEDTHMLPAGQTFQRKSIEQSKLGSQEDVKEWLLSIGWKPDEYNMKKDGFKWITLGPKLTTSSLEKLGETGKMVDEYYILRHRAGFVEGWINKVEGTDDKRLHGNMWCIGTPTFRVRHEVIANLPGVSSPWGKEIRGMLKADPGMVIVGADSAGNQLRGLCHYVGNDDFTNEVRYGDQHQRNADALGCSRPIAKNYLYAYLFGAGDSKLGKTLTGKSNADVGKKSREDFAKGIKGLDELRSNLQNTWKEREFKQGIGWFCALDGRPVFASSAHQTLNYLLQSAEGITCKAALSHAWRKIREEGLRAEPRLFYHDEFAFQSHPDDADRVGEILKESFEEGPKEFNVFTMDGGNYQIGDSYAAVH